MSYSSHNFCSEGEEKSKAGSNTQKIGPLNIVNNYYPYKNMKDGVT